MGTFRLPLNTAPADVALGVYHSLSQRLWNVMHISYSYVLCPCIILSGVFHAPDRSARECATLNAEKDSHNIFPQWYVVIRRLVPIPASIGEVGGGGAGGVAFPKDRFMQSMSCKGSYDSEWYIIFLNIW